MCKIYYCIIYSFLYLTQLSRFISFLIYSIFNLSTSVCTTILGELPPFLICAIGTNFLMISPHPFLSYSKCSEYTFQNMNPNMSFLCSKPFQRTSENLLRTLRHNMRRGPYLPLQCHLEP